jgi:hypothetical protein
MAAYILKNLFAARSDGSPEFIPAFRRTPYYSVPSPAILSQQSRSGRAFISDCLSADAIIIIYPVWMSRRDAGIRSYRVYQIKLAGLRRETAPGRRIILERAEFNESC